MNRRLLLVYVLTWAILSAITSLFSAFLLWACGANLFARGIGMGTWVACTAICAWVWAAVCKKKWDCEREYKRP